MAALRPGVDSSMMHFFTHVPAACFACLRMHACARVQLRMHVRAQAKMHAYHTWLPAALPRSSGSGSSRDACFFIRLALLCRSAST